MNAENSKRAENNWDDDDNDITNEKDLCLSFIESFKNSRNLSFEIEKNTSLSLKKIDQALFDVKFFDIDDFLRLLRVCAVSLASEKSQLCKDVTQSSMKQSSLSRMSNSMFSINDESMIATITLKVWNSLKRKTNTVNMNEGSRVKIHDKTIFTSTSMCLTILQNSHLKFSITSKSISHLSNQSLNLVMSETRIQTSCRLKRSSSHWASRYWLFRNWVNSTSSVRHRLSVQISAHVFIVVSTFDNSRRLDHDQRYW